MTAKRFMEMSEPNMRESDNGAYVRWEDYEKLQRAYESTLLALDRYEKPGDVVRVAPRSHADQWTPEEMARFRMEQAINLCQGCFRPVGNCVCNTFRQTPP